MKVTRTFHPVGQGAFYSERFYMEDQQGTVHNIVYDCGVKWGYKGKVKHVVTQAFTQSDVIEYLFISHLDYDHVSLVKTFIDNVRAVRNIVLPLVTEEQLVIALAYHKISGHKTMTDFISRILNHLRGRGGEDFKDGEYTLHFVAGPDEEHLHVGNASIWQNGTSQAAPWKPEWIFKPYNVKYSSRKQDLIAELAQLVMKRTFIAEIQNIGENPIPSADELYDKLKDDAFVRKVLSNDVLRGLLKGAYEKISGGTNENSLLLYSGPVSDDLDYYLKRCVPCEKFWCCRYEKAGCLYTGDSTADLSGWKNQKYDDVWECVGTIQLPHHGSVDSFDVTTNSIDRPYVVPVSFGNYNTYGHPSGKVLAYLIMKDCCIHFVTEMANTVFIEEIEKWR